MLIEYDLCTCIPRTVGNEELWNIYCRGLIYFTPAIQWSNDIEYHRLIITNAHTLARTAFDNPYSLYVDFSRKRQRLRFLWRSRWTHSKDEGSYPPVLSLKSSDLFLSLSQSQDATPLPVDGHRVFKHRMSASCDNFQILVQVTCGSNSVRVEGKSNV